MSHILIASILHRSKAYAYPRFFSWCAHQRQFRVQFYHQYDSGEYGDWEKVKRMRENARLEALRLGSEGLFFIDVDTIPPFDVIRLLLEKSNGDMITGIYLGSPQPHYPVVWKYDDPYQDFLREEVSDIDGAGLGCCLINRSVLEKCTFDTDDQWEDISFWKQAKEKGFKCQSVNSVLCQHQLSTNSFFEPEAPGGYQIRCPDGVTINGHKYTGRVYHNVDSVMAADEPYRTGKVKATTSVGGGFSPHERSKNQ